MDLKKSWRTMAASLVGVSLLTVASLSFAGAQQNTAGNRASSPTRAFAPAVRSHRAPMASSIYPSCPR